MYCVGNYFRNGGIRTNHPDPSPRQHRYHCHSRPPALDELLDDDETNWMTSWTIATDGTAWLVNRQQRHGVLEVGSRVECVHSVRNTSRCSC